MLQTAPMLPGLGPHLVPQLGALASASRLLGSIASVPPQHGGAGFQAVRGFATGAVSTPAASSPGHKPAATHAPPTRLDLKPGAGSFAAGAVAPHPGINPARMAADSASAAAGASGDAALAESYMAHPAYSDEYVESVRPTHVTPQKLHQHVGLRTIQVFRYLFDKATGYTPTGSMTEAQWLRRMIFLETVAGCPGMVAGMLRHLKSLRSMSRDRGWIHTLLEEAENERMHLITFLQLRQPGPAFRAMVILAQGVFFNAYFIAYLLSPRTCHAFVGFLEEEAVKTYTHALVEIDAGRLWKDTPAPPVAVQYWGLKPGANMRDLILAVRADEACHAHVNHTLSQLNPSTDANPFATGASQLP
ncbi:hypothetical protein CHLRE_09g395950v5 [Chlamydomonas reinhardtii]|uniref:Ubiquinol oxidase n=1 Tax=Chlamydomonas reinhardtii TaxID=3055 RepID=O65000_CHLRE|nr:uncharacterized protein CHLRE_09g395950v5 [Chlamydomonas reinhardtii]AAC05743.2 alternative oxidase [Chlamydomonas reinhardtii]AAG33633.1 alternative oxidase 1 [Chlamydomonas reinhardtii]PNW78476.1 hypothetical protein CHLRE_09g395950v5 [Chlamydomonas reinhardtii]|eukprot:XP_001694605.1 alternative oxidase, isoform 1 [Chlamydomonas reinhardtii]